MQATGRIVAVQESRFRLRTDAGQVYLLTLARNAPLDATALQRLQRQRAHVTVDFDGEANLVGGVAHDVRQSGA